MLSAPVLAKLRAGSESGCRTHQSFSTCPFQLNADTGVVLIQLVAYPGAGVIARGIEVLIIDSLYQRMYKSKAETNSSMVAFSQLRG